MSVIKHLHLDDVLSAGTGCLQAFVHDGDGDIELIDDIGWDATVSRRPTTAGDPNVGPGTRHVEASQLTGGRMSGTMIR